LGLLARSLLLLDFSEEIALLLIVEPPFTECRRVEGLLLGGCLLLKTPYQAL